MFKHFLPYCCPFFGLHPPNILRQDLELIVPNDIKDGSLDVKMKYEKIIPSEWCPDLPSNDKDLVTYLCPVDSCTFLTLTLSDKLVADHFTTQHSQLSPTQQTFLTL